MNQTLVKYNSLFKQSEFSKNRIYLEDMIKSILTTKETSFKEINFNEISQPESTEEVSIKMPSLSRISQNNHSHKQQDTSFNTF
jgi:hypothetical protein